MHAISPWKLPVVVIVLDAGMGCKAGCETGPLVVDRGRRCHCRQQLGFSENREAAKTHQQIEDHCDLWNGSRGADFHGHGHGLGKLFDAVVSRTKPAAAFPGELNRFLEAVLCTIAHGENAH